jgi:hypothetical protein
VDLLGAFGSRSPFPKIQERLRNCPQLPETQYFLARIRERGRGRRSLSFLLKEGSATTTVTTLVKCDLTLVQTPKSSTRWPMD